MHAKDLIDLAHDPNLIPGIYNYCDRWCERCPFSSRCLVYLTEKEDDDGDPASRDITNEKFWKKLAGIFQEARELITAWAGETGVDLNAEVLESEVTQRKLKRIEAGDHPLAKAAEDYARSVSEWFRPSSEPQLVTDMPIDSQSEENGYEEEEAADVIQWYQFFIAAKVMRALMSRVHEAEDAEIDECQADAYPKDSEGSMKVALIAIDRSIGAWKLMAELRAEKADSIRQFLIQLEKLRLRLEKAFPTARDFVRPGFDEAGIDVIN